MKTYSPKDYFISNVRYQKNQKPITAWIFKENDRRVINHLLINGLLQCDSKILRYQSHLKHFLFTINELANQLENTENAQFGCKKCLDKAKNKLINLKENN